MNHIILDIEATCWKSWQNQNEMEIIEIGAVKLSADWVVLGEFDRFIRPVIHPKLSSFCTKLTSIRQIDVNRAEIFPTVFADFQQWIGDEPYDWYSWGNYDRKQFVKDLAYHQMTWGEVEQGHTNLKEVFANRRALERPVGMMRALKMMQIEFDGRHHRGIDDARHITKIAQAMFGVAG